MSHRTHRLHVDDPRHLALRVLVRLPRPTAQVATLAVLTVLASTRPRLKLARAAARHRVEERAQAGDVMADALHDAAIDGSPTNAISEHAGVVLGTVLLFLVNGHMHRGPAVNKLGNIKPGGAVGAGGGGGVASRRATDRLTTGEAAAGRGSIKDGIDGIDADATEAEVVDRAAMPTGVVGGESRGASDATARRLAQSSLTSTLATPACTHEVLA
eukprot:CAMPEP_0176073464 /NCGR_PEP_ID=MMETSP0120_2-20121206/36707_1 /TAXON_ID=160619 /ORGANISM="Kryptoperidinium foliaceum, Strain CCMP 1326" /LENGTH=214 /DNA_ID=CAMNT_0017407147 /DNA_START=72 /DNA_END=718 /DNA_ORIENTATION=+